MKAHCPRCGLDFDQPRNAKGAGYALGWTVLPGRCQKLLAWWLSSPYVHAELTKDQIIKFYRGTTLGGLLARIPELYALGLIDKIETGAEFGGSKYKLNLPKAAAVLNASGRLEVLKTTGASAA